MLGTCLKTLSDNHSVLSFLLGVIEKIFQIISSLIFLKLKEKEFPNNIFLTSRRNRKGV